MFSNNDSFEEKFKQFYDLNRPVLIHQELIDPDEDRKRNSDNIAIKFLLAEFTKVAINGTPEEKAVVKSFFLGREDKRDLAHLQNPSSKDMGAILPYESHYVRFFIKQQFQEKKFDLFTSEEQIKLINGIRMYKLQIPPQEFIQLFRLPFESLSLACLEQLMPLVTKAAFPNRKSIFLAHLERHGAPGVLTQDAVTLIKLVTESEPNSADRVKLLKQFQWSLPQEVNGTNHLTPDDLLFIYRTFDAQLVFPSSQVQEHFSRLVMQRIKAIEDRDERIKALETLLFVKDKINLPLSNIQLRNEAIGLLVEDLGDRYGKDDQSPDYKEKMITVINRLFTNVAKRDVTLLLSRLANKIVSQWEVTEHLGILLETDKYLPANKQEKIDFTIGNLAAASRTLSEDKKDVVEFLEFISSPISSETTDKFAGYLLQHNKINRLAEDLGYGREMAEIEKEHQGTIALMLRTLYAQFWDLSLEERAVIIDHLLIPASKVKTAAEVEDAYEEGFLYVTQKLFPNAKTDKDEEFAFALLKASLDTSDKYIRSHLLAGMLVATNQSNELGKQPSAGKKLAMLCEHMGPAYVKLAQAVHSHPSTPEPIRRDLNHIKGRANPPHR